MMMTVMIFLIYAQSAICMDGKGNLTPPLLVPYIGLSPITGTIPHCMHLDPANK